jgi:hypothetical protein
LRKAVVCAAVLRKHGIGLNDNIEVSFDIGQLRCRHPGIAGTAIHELLSEIGQGGRRNFRTILAPTLRRWVFWCAREIKDWRDLPSRPGEFHPEPLTEPDLILSHHPARAIA